MSASTKKIFGLRQDFPFVRMFGFFLSIFTMGIMQPTIDKIVPSPYYSITNKQTGEDLIIITELYFWILVLIVYVAVLVYLFIIPLTLHFRPDSFLSHLFIKDEKAESKKDEKAESKSFPIEKQIDGTTVILLYILSFFIPLAGFIVGAIYASKDEEHYKHVGKNCLIFSVLNIVLVLFSYILIALILFA